MKKTLIIFGATGKQGGSVINSLLADPVTKEAFHIKGVTRDTTKPAALALKDRGVEPIQANMDDPESLRAALEGAYGVFAVTNYWESVNKDLEVKQGKNIADAAKHVGVQHLVWSSLIDVNKETSGALTGVLHFDGKNEVERYITEIGVPASFFYAGVYMQNFIPGSLMGFGKEGDGFVFRVPIGDDAIFPMFDVDDSGKFVKPLFKKGLTSMNEVKGFKSLAATAYITAKDAVATVAKVTGKPVKFDQITADDFKKSQGQTPEFIVKEILENLYLFKPEYGYYAKASLDPTLATLEEKPTTWEEFVKKNVDSFN